jgi:hypothetical protein
MMFRKLVLLSAAALMAVSVSTEGLAQPHGGGLA